MTEEAQRIAIAEACPFVANGTRGYTWWFRQEEIVFDPANDLNAMHEAEKALAFNQFTYLYNLTKEVNLANPELAFDWAICHATAAQRAEAFLRTISKWRD